MHKARILLIVGIWITILSYLGFPQYLKNILFVLTGLGVIFFSYLLYMERKKEDIVETPSDNYKENSFNETVKVNEFIGETLNKEL